MDDGRQLVLVSFAPTKPTCFRRHLRGCHKSDDTPGMRIMRDAIRPFANRRKTHADRGRSPTGVWRLVKRLLALTPSGPTRDGGTA